MRHWPHLDTTAGARAVPARSTWLDRGGLEHSGAFSEATERGALCEQRALPRCRREIASRILQKEPTPTRTSKVRNARRHPLRENLLAQVIDLPNRFACPAHHGAGALMIL